MYNFVDSETYTLIFARSTVCIFNLWQALKLAVNEGWGGPESTEKRTWLISVIVDEYEQRPPNNQNGSPGGLDYDFTEELIAQAFEDEFGATLEDGSPRQIARQLRQAWSEAILGDESYCKRLEYQFEKQKSSKLNFTRGEDEEIPYDDDDDNGNDMQVDSQQSNQPSTSEPKPKQEKVFDDDGFEVVQKKPGRR